MRSRPMAFGSSSGDGPVDSSGGLPCLWAEIADMTIGSRASSRSGIQRLSNQSSGIHGAIRPARENFVLNMEGSAMPSAPLKFRATEVTRAVKAMRKAGVGVARVDIMPDGRISILPIGDSEAPPLAEARPGGNE